MEPQLDMPGGNGHPIAIAAGQLPEPVQASIPGLKPAFDVESALTMIEDAAQEARIAEAAYDGAKARAKQKRADADAANTTLRDLIRDLAGRRHDARYEAEAEASDPGDVPGELDAHALPGGLPGTGGVGEPDVEDASAAAVSDVPALGDLGTAPETPTDTAQQPVGETSSLEPPHPSSPSLRRPRSRRRAQ